MRTDSSSLAVFLQHRAAVAVLFWIAAATIAMTSIRMEPVWMTLAQSAGVAAAIAVRASSAVQDVPYPELRRRLLALNLRLERPV